MVTKQLRKSFLILFCIALTGLSKQALGQRVFVNEYGKIYEIDWSTIPFTYKEVTGFCANYTIRDVFSICLYKDTLYYNTNSGNGEIYAFNINNPASCRIVGYLNFRGGLGGTRLNSMTVDKDGNIYGALFELGTIIKFNPRTGQVTNLGQAPANPAGDLIFYKDKLYMATAGYGIYEINLEDPSLSTSFIPFNQFDAWIYGLISVPKNCNENAIYAISAFGDFYELDFNTRKATGTKFKLPLSLFDAASGVEDGNTQGVFISKVEIKAPCLARETTADIRIVASTADTGKLTWSMNGGAAQDSGFFGKVPLGKHSFRATNRRGCSTDTVIEVTRGVASFNLLEGIGPKDCTTPNGSISAKATSAYLPVLYSIGTGPTGSSGVFNGLTMGNYTIKAIDNGGCSIDSTISLAFKERPDFFESALVSPTICTAKTGKIEIRLKGTSDGITTQINQQPIRNQLLYDGLDAGAYKVSVIKNGNCRVDTMVTIPLVSDPKPAISIATTHQVCSQPNGKIAVEIRGNETPYLIDFMNTGYTEGRVYSSLFAGKYNFTISNIHGCTLDTSAVVLPYVYAPVTLRADSVMPTCNNYLGGSISFEVTGPQSPFSIVAFNGQRFTGQGTLSGLREGSYVFNVFNGDGCILDSFHVSLTISDLANCSFLYVPTAFTPNGDGLNEVLKPRYSARDTDTRFSVFNRFGELVFSTNDRAAGWDGTFKGKKQPAGVFIWKVSLLDINGIRQQYKGTVTLIR